MVDIDSRPREPPQRPPASPSGMASPHFSDDDQLSLDPSEPFRGIIVCCTSIPPEQRTDIAQKTAELGGIHKYDLTPDVTHLVVGDYDTPKYRHVARERPDIKAMDPAWIEAVSKLWRNDDEIDFRALETEYQLKPLEKAGAEPSASGEPTARDSLLICLTGFGDQRDGIAEKISRNGGRYTGDLSRRCSHLIASKPEGKKFTAAKSWGVQTVTLDWLLQSIERGMILEETKFDPLLPPEEQGVDAWKKENPRRAALRKRSRSTAVLNAPEDGSRKLRKTASLKLNAQKNNLWGDILGRSTSREYSFAHEQEQAPLDEDPTQISLPLQEDRGVFSNCVFYIHGFDKQRSQVLDQTIGTLDGSVVATLQEASLKPALREPSYRFLVVPQTSQPDTHPTSYPDSIHIVTEFYIEQCLHNKQFIDPSDNTLGRPFPVFPIEGFSDLTVCSAAFTGLELNQVARSVKQLGARFDEEFRKTTSVLVCKSLQAMRKDKLKYALDWGVPVVPADWLWECIACGTNVPIQDFVFPELKGRYAHQAERTEKKRIEKHMQRTKSEPALRTGKPNAPKAHGIGADTSGFDGDSANRNPKKPTRGALHEESTTSADFFTARTRPDNTLARGLDGPLSELSAASLNKSPSPKNANDAGVGPRIKSEASSKSAGEKTTPPERTLSDGPETNQAVETGEPETSAAVATETVIISKEKEQELQDEEEEEEEEEALARRAREDEAKKQAKAAERQALTSKITSLIHSATTGTPSSNPEPRQQPPRPRRRQILGRAVSNASNASSDTSARPGAASALLAADESGPRDRGTDGSNDHGRDHDGLDDNADAPSATQLEYHDPDASKVKAALINRMMGESEKLQPSTTRNSAAVVPGGGATVAVPDGEIVAGRDVSVVGGRSLRRR